MRWRAEALLPETRRELAAVSGLDETCSRPSTSRDITTYSRYSPMKMMFLSIERGRRNNQLAAADFDKTGLLRQEQSQHALQIVCISTKKTAPGWMITRTNTASRTPGKIAIRVRPLASAMIVVRSAPPRPRSVHRHRRGGQFAHHSRSRWRFAKASAGRSLLAAVATHGEVFCVAFILLPPARPTARPPAPQSTTGKTPRSARRSRGRTRDP